MAAVVARRQARRVATAATWRQRFAVAAVLLAAKLIVLWPLLEHPGLPQTADLELHLVRAVQLDILVRDGWFYPRWAPDFAYGYGFPFFNFYAPLGSYLIAGLHWLGLDFPVALKVAFIGTFFLYGPAMYLFARRFVPPVPATVAAVAYVFVPFRFRELFHQADFSQYLAMALLPLAFAALHDLVERPTPRSFGATVVTTSALMLAHNITAFHAGVFLGVYGVLLARTYGWRQLVWIAFAGLSNLLLTAFFWLPALAEQHLVQLYRLRTDDFHFSHHFPAPWELIAPSPVVDRVLANPAVPHNLGITHLLLSLASLLGLVFWMRARRALRVHFVFGWATLLLAVFLMLPISTPVWERAPLLDYTEFPWRFRNLAGLGTAVLIGLGVHWLLSIGRAGTERLASGIPEGGRGFRAEDVRRSSSLDHREVVQGAVIGSSSIFRAVLPAIATVLVIGPNLVHLYPHVPFLAYDVRTAADISRFELITGAIGTTSAGEYYPIWVVDRPEPSPNAGLLEPSSAPSGAAAQLIERRSLHQRYQLQMPVSARMTFNVLFFPGWQVRVDGQPVAAYPIEPHGFIGVDVPAGAHDLELDFVGTPLRNGAEVLSAISLLLGTMGLLLWQRRRSGHPSGAETDGSATAAVTSLSVYQVAIAATALIGLLVLKEGVLDTWSVFSYSSPPGQVRGVMHPATATLGGQIRLLGHDVPTSVLKPGEDVRVTLYWQPVAPVPRDYRGVVKIVRRSTGEVVAQSDREHPGGMPTSRWRSDLYVRDEHVVRLPKDLPAMSYDLVVGLYDAEGLRPLPRDGASGSGSDILPLSPITVGGARVAADRIAHPLPWRFDVGIAFLGYAYTTASAPGETVEVELFWRAERSIPYDYTVFVHLLDSNEQRVAQADGTPLHGDYPTSTWAEGDEIADRYQLQLPANIAPGSYRLLVGFYDPQTGQRLEMRSPGDQPTHQLLLEPPLTVQSP